MVMIRKDDENSQWRFSAADIDETIDGKSKSKAYALFESSLLNTKETGTVKGLQQIHGYLFGGLYNFAGLIRTLNIAKDGFKFGLGPFFAGNAETY